MSFSRIHCLASKLFLIGDKWFIQWVIFPQGVCILIDIIHLAKQGGLIVVLSLTCSWPGIMQGGLQAVIHIKMRIYAICGICCKMLPFALNWPTSTYLIYRLWFLLFFYPFSLFSANVLWFLGHNSVEYKECMGFGV